MTDLSKYEFTKRENILFYCGIITLAIFLSFLFYRSIVFSIVIIPFINRLRAYVTEILIQRRKCEFLIEFKDALFILSTAIGAGRSMKDAIGEAIPGVRDIHGENAILAKDLDVAYERMSIGGETDVDVLTDLAVSSGIEDIIDFVTVYSICKTTGASMILALNKAANVIIEKMTIDKEVREIVRRKESEGLIIFIMPVLVILFLNLSSPDYIAPLYDTLAGRLIMTFVIAANIGIYGIIQKVTRVEI